jgi:hypothetical protein
MGFCSSSRLILTKESSYCRGWKRAGDARHRFLLSCSWSLPQRKIWQRQGGLLRWVLLYCVVAPHPLPLWCSYGTIVLFFAITGDKQIPKQLISYTFAALYPDHFTVGYGAFDFWILLSEVLLCRLSSSHAWLQPEKALLMNSFKFHASGCDILWYRERPRSLLGSYFRVSFVFLSPCHCIMLWII